MRMERLACIHSISTKRIQARGTDEYISDNNIIVRIILLLVDHA